MTLLYVWLVGVALVWGVFYYAAASEPTAHGQSILLPMGCAAGIFWPLVLAYLVVASPFIAYTWFTSRDERR